MPTTEGIVLRLIEALISEWSKNHSLEEIACDETKVDLLIDVLKSVPEAADIPENVRTVFREVFLADVWDPTIRRQRFIDQ